MQLLYANDGINYRTISKSQALSLSAEKALLGSYMKYEFVSNKIYSSISNEPEAITYAVSNLNNELSKNHLIVSKAGHMSNYSRPCYYFHALIKEVDDDFFKEQFFEIFNYQFVRDANVNQYNTQNIDNYQFSNELFNKVALTDEQLITILATFMNNEKSNRKTKIIVDERGDQYNRRSREILSSIYHYLPYELRKRYGFLSYSKDENGGSGRISFVLYAKDEIRNINNTYIQLDEIDLSDLNNKIDAEYLQYATYLVSELDEEGRKKHFQILTTIANNGRLKIDDCITYYINYKKWMNGKQENLLPEWISYVDQNSFRKGPLYELMVGIISSKISNDYYNQYLFENVLELYNEKINSLSPNAKKVIRFADCISNIQIDSSKFSNWYQKQLDEKLKGLNKNNSNDIIKYKKIYENEIAVLSDLNIGSDGLTELLNQNIKKIKQSMLEIDGLLDGAEEEESEKIGEKFRNLQNVSLEEFIKKVAVIKDSIVFENNIEIFNLNIEEWIEDHLYKCEMFEFKLLEYKQLIEDMKDNLKIEAYQRFNDRIDSQLNSIAEQKKSRSFNITTKQTVLDTYNHLQSDMLKGVLKLDDEIEVSFDVEKKQMKVKDLIDILEFVLVPQDMNQTVQIYMDCLFKLKLLSVSHFEYLVDGSKEYDLKRIVDYYFKYFDPIEISGFYVGNVLNKKSSKTAKSIADYYQDFMNKEAISFISTVNKKRVKKKEVDDFDDFDVEVNQKKSKKKGFWKF